jgi:hypothetical protein
MNDDLMYVGTMFDGDGRKRLVPINAPAMSLPTVIQRGNARRLIDSFLACGASTHSARGATMWVITEFCKNKGMRYRIEVSECFTFQRVVRLSDGHKFKEKGLHVPSHI